MVIKIDQVEKFWQKSYDKHVKNTLKGSYLKEDLGKILVEAMETYSEKVGFYFMARYFTYKEILEYSRRFASFLQKEGIEKGDVVAINLPNCPQYLFAVYGSYIAGAVCTGVSPLLSEVETQFQLNNCNAKVVVTMDVIHEKRFSKIIDKIPKVEIFIPTNISDYMGFSKFKVFIGKLVKKIPKGKAIEYPGRTVIPFLNVMNTPIDINSVEINPNEDLCLIQYTGGTTGKPKGTEIRHCNLAYNMIQFENWLNRKKGTDIVLSAFPYFHIAGFFIGLYLTYIGAAHVIIPNPRDTDHIIDEIRDKKPTVFGNVPTLYLMIQKNPRSKEISLETLENINLYVSGAAPFPEEAVKEFEKQFHTQNKFVEVYGMTESALLITVNPVIGQKKIGTVGLPLPDTEVKIVDVETGNRVSIGEAGEICVKGPQITRSYYNNPEATAETYVDGWLHTGDVGVFDEDGYLKIVDRIKDMISVSGFKVFSVHVEEVLTKHPNIQIVAIIGVPDPERPGSEIVKAMIQLKSGIKATDKVKETIKQFAKEHLAKYEVPKIWEFTKELPTTAVGKVLKRAIRKDD
jgi:long-chain acyl-CoA synthetase